MGAAGVSRSGHEARPRTRRSRPGQCRNVRASRLTTTRRRSRPSDSRTSTNRRTSCWAWWPAVRFCGSAGSLIWVEIMPAAEVRRSRGSVAQAVHDSSSEGFKPGSVETLRSNARTTGIGQPDRAQAYGCRCQKCSGASRNRRLAASQARFRGPVCHRRGGRWLRDFTATRPRWP